MHTGTYKDRLVAKFLSKGGGVFTKPTGKKLLGLKEIPGKDLKKSQFWEQQREDVKAALIDLEVFIETAGEENISQVFTKESLEPIVTSLLWGKTALAKPDLNRAEIAQLFIKWGFEYLSSVRPDLMTSPHEQTKFMATDLANFIVESTKPMGEGRYSRPGQAAYGY